MNLLAAVGLGLTLVFASVTGSLQNTPPAGTTVVVKLMDGVDSASDPAGKQYHASVAKPVNAGNGVTIAQGASANVTLARSGSGWATQLSAVSVNGQMVAVTSSSASVANATQSAAGAVNSVLGGFGHHTNTPPSLSAVATGQRVILPPGSTLSFVLSSPPAPNTPPSNTLPAASATPADSTTPVTAAPSSPGPQSPYHCISQGLKGNKEIVYSNQVILVNEADSHNVVVAFQKYMQETYQTGDLKSGSDRCERVSAVPAQQAYTLSSEEKQWAASKWEVVHVQWTFAPGQVTPATNAVPAPASGSSGLYLYCFSDPDGPVIYFSDFFLAEPDPGVQRGVSFKNVQNAYMKFLQQQYAFKSGSNYPTSCSNALNTDAGIRYAQTKKQKMEGDYRQARKQIVETGWKYTPPPGGASPAQAPSSRPLHH